MSKKERVHLISEIQSQFLPNIFQMNQQHTTQEISTLVSWVSCFYKGENVNFSKNKLVEGTPFYR